MRKPLAQRQRERYAQIKAKRTPAPAPAPAPAPMKMVEQDDLEDASELEYQEKTSRRKRSYTRRKKDDQ